MSYPSAAGYSGDMLSSDACGLLAGDPESTLIDPWTQAEWAYVGVPDLSSLAKAPLFLEWRSYPVMQVDERFVARLSTMLETAVAITTAGWAPCFNLPDGFEGPLNPRRYRSAISGWKAGDLPWV